VARNDKKKKTLLGRSAYSIAETARMLGMSQGAIRNAVRSGQLPSARLGGRILIPRASIELLLDARDPKGGSST